MLQKKCVEVGSKALGWSHVRMMARSATWEDGHEIAAPGCRVKAWLADAKGARARIAHRRLRVLSNQSNLRGAG